MAEKKVKRGGTILLPALINVNQMESINSELAPELIIPDPMAFLIKDLLPALELGPVINRGLVENLWPGLKLRPSLIDILNLGLNPGLLTGDSLTETMLKRLLTPELFLSKNLTEDIKEHNLLPHLFATSITENFSERELIPQLYLTPALRKIVTTKAEEPQLILPPSLPLSARVVQVVPEIEPTYDAYGLSLKEHRSVEDLSPELVLVWEDESLGKNISDYILTTDISPDIKLIPDSFGELITDILSDTDLDPYMDLQLDPEQYGKAITDVLSDTDFAPYMDLQLDPELYGETITDVLSDTDFYPNFEISN